MRHLGVYNTVSLDGYYVDVRGDLGWAHQQDPEWNEYVASNARGGADTEFLFGRKTWDMMSRWWPTPQARSAMPEVAKAMNETAKHVVSRTASSLAAWENSSLVAGELVQAVTQLKASPGKDLLILGSGEVVAQLAKAGLIDSFRVVIRAVVLGAGRSMFAGVERHPLRLTDVSKRFQNGNVVLTYERG